MVDLHVHILPGLDDGANNIDDALEMAEMAVESGVKRIVVTPHGNQMGRFENFYSDELVDSYQQFRQALDDERIPLEAFLGMEIFASEDMCQRMLEGSLIGLNGTDTYLIEFPFEADPFWIGEQLENVLDINKIPLIAHPERYFCVQEFPGLVYEWLSIGCLTQVNKGSVLGRFGRGAGVTSEILLNNDLVTCIASDGHSPYMRTPYMGEIRQLLEEHFSGQTAYRLLKENPERILANKKIPTHGNAPERKKWFFR